MLQVKSEDIKWKETPTGETIAVLVGRHVSTGEAKEQTVAIVELSPGKSSDPHFHGMREESYYFLEGSGLAKIDDVEVSVKQGDLVFTKPRERHQFINTGMSNLRYLVLTSPTWIPEDSHRL